MTQKNRTDLKAGWNTNITDGGQNTAAEMRTELNHVADSCFNILTDTVSNISGISAYQSVFSGRLGS